MGIGDRVDRITELMDRIIEREEQYESFLNASPWGILVTDKAFSIVFINKTLERMCGYSLGEVMGKNIHMLMPEEDAKLHVKHEKKYIKKPIQRMGNYGLRPRLLHKNGAIVPVEISLAPTKVHGQTFYFASIRLLDTLFNTTEYEEREGE